MGKVISVGNQKGGVGKTTVSLNLGIGLARQGKKVALIDADMQGDLTKSLGFRKLEENQETTASIIGKIIQDKEYEPMAGFLEHEEGVMLLPSDRKLADMEVTLVNVMSREYMLRDFTERIRDAFDYILIDCMPSLGMVTINALVAADTVLIPVQAEYLPVSDLQELIRTVGMVKKRLNPKLGIEGIVINRLDRRTKDAKEISALIEKNYGSKVTIFSQPIPASVRAPETSASGGSIYRYDSRSKVAQAFESLTKEVLAHGE